MDTSISSSSSNHRLLYRGALELPDSYILLDGLSFTLQLKDKLPKSSPSVDLLQNPLPLALESMRGRPSLPFLGATKVNDVFVDSSCDASVYIHPNSVVTQIYLENMLCIPPINSSDGKTEYGIRVGLGDQGVPGSSEVLIYGHLPPHAPSSFTELQLFAARIVPKPPPAIRLPRPDDPTPRKPPLVIFGEKQTQRSQKVKEEAAVKRPKDATTKLSSLGPSSRSLSRTSSKHAFKIPDVPQKVGEGTDLFGSSAGSNASSKSKEPALTSEELDRRNKAEIKKSAVRYMAKYGIHKEHREFKDLFGFIYRGTSFALRLFMNSRTLDSRIIDEQVEMHVQMYVRGDGVFMRLA